MTKACCFRSFLIKLAAYIWTLIYAHFLIPAIVFALAKFTSAKSVTFVAKHNSSSGYVLGRVFVVAFKYFDFILQIVVLA